MSDLTARLRTDPPFYGNEDAQEAADRIDALDAEVARLDLRYRTLMWASHYHPTAMKYGDDGELQCGGFDFKRRSLEDCEQHRADAALPALNQPDCYALARQLAAALVPVEKWCQWDLTADQYAAVEAALAAAQAAGIEVMP